jgi:hypothetical protein
MQPDKLSLVHTAHTIEPSQPENAMNRSLLVALLALSCGAAFAQAPAGTTPRPAQETSPTAAGGAPAAKAETKTEAKKGESAAAMGAGAGSTATGTKSMDADGDGSVSKKEWDTYHSAMWKKVNKGGKASMADVEAMMKGGPN